MLGDAAVIEGVSSTAKGNSATCVPAAAFKGGNSLVNQARLAEHCSQVERYWHSACETAFDTAAVRFAELSCNHYCLRALIVQ